MIESHNLVKMENPMIEEAIKNDFGFEVKNIEKVTKGYSSQVYEAEMDGNKIYVRINKDPKIFESEILGYEIFKKQGIPVPEILAYKENPETIKEPTMIMSAAKGSLINKNTPEEERSITFKNVGKLLHKINETKIEGYGKVIPKAGHLVGNFSTWKEFWADQQGHNDRALDFLIENKIVNSEEIEKIKKIYEEIGDLDFGKASLLHLDVHHGHFFTNKGEITGLIDLGMLTAGDPRYDIAMSLIFQKNEDRENFKQGYGELANDPIVNKYYAIIAIRKIYFRSKPGMEKPEESAKFIQELKDVLERV